MEGADRVTAVSVMQTAYRVRFVWTGIAGLWRAIGGATSKSAS